MAFAVAITRLAPGAVSEATRGPEAAALAPLLGAGAYELRVALGGAVPVVLARNATHEAASAWVDVLRGRGYGAVLCDESHVERGDEMFAPRDFVFGPHGLVGEVNSSSRAELAWTDLVAVIAAARLRSETSSVETSHKQFSLGRAALTGGLSMSKKVTKTERRSHDERESVAYLLNGRGSGAWLLVSSQLRYGGLGDRRAPAAHQNFQTLLAMLKQHAAQALHDARLMKQNRLASKLVVSSGTVPGTVTTTNSAEVDLAVQMLATAHTQGQL
ncbi:MAG TPA: hypothetical protein PKD61_15675 [Polyangiaceae bacterium]|nr:hypothetical protein [Polyangiaceae bacterium]